MAGWEIRELVCQVYKKLIPPKPNDSPLKVVIDTLRDKAGLHGIMTFNYETSVEQILKKGVVYVLPNRAWNAVGGGIPLCKLHGSLNWEQNAKGVSPKGVDEFDTVQMVFRSGEDWVQPSIIGPNFFKQEITIDFQTDQTALFYKRLWRICWDALREVDSLVFIGFSFPTTDFHIRALFDSVHRTRQFKKVAICTKNDSCAFVKAKNLFPGAKFKPFDAGLEGLDVKKLQDFLNG